MIKISIAKTKKEIIQSILLRRKVLVEECKYSRLEDEPDLHDLNAVIYLAKDEGKVLGTARIRKDKRFMRIQRMAIDKNYRNKGIGSKLIAKICLDYKDDKIYLMSPDKSIKFYSKFGFNKTTITQRGKAHLYHRLEKL